MSRVLIKKAERQQIAERIRKVIVDIFGAYAIDGQPVPKVEPFGGLSPDELKIEGAYYECRTGQVYISVNVSPTSIFVHCCVGESRKPLTADEVKLAKRMGGNTYSGKINYHGFPDSKITADWIEGQIEDIINHLRLIKWPDIVLGSEAA